MKVKSTEEILDGLIPDQQIAKLAFLELEIYQRIAAMNEEEKVSLLVGYGFNVFGDESQQELDDKLFEAVAASTIPRWELKKIAQDGKPCPKCGHELQEKSNAEDLMRWSSYYYCPSCGAEYTPSMLNRESTGNLKTASGETVIARWEAARGKRFIELYKYTDDLGDERYGYRGDGQGGSAYSFSSDEEAIDWCENASWGSPEGGAGPVFVLKSDFPSVKRVAKQAARNRSALGNEDMDEDSLTENAQSEQGLLDKAWPVIQNMSDQQMTEILNRYGIESTHGISHEQLISLMFESVENGQVSPEDLGVKTAAQFDKSLLESRSAEELQAFLYEQLDKDFDLRDRDGMEKAIEQAVNEGTIDASELEWI